MCTRQLGVSVMFTEMKKVKSDWMRQGPRKTTWQSGWLSGQWGKTEHKRQAVWKRTRY